MRADSKPRRRPSQTWNPHVTPRNGWWAQGTAAVILPRFGFLRTLRGSRGQEGSSPEQIQAGSAVHLTLEQLEAVDLPLSLPAAPW